MSTQNSHHWLAPTYSSLASIERKLTEAIIRFACNPTDQRLENGIKHRIVSVASFHM